MFEVYVLVAKRKPTIIRFGAIFCFILGGLSTLATAIGLFIFLPFAIGGLLLGYFLHTRNYEFEYSFFDDEVRFAKIINKSRRKKLPGYKMAEVMAIAPKGHDRVSQYEKDNTAAVRNLCSGFKDARIYVMAAKDKDGIDLVYFEPDETYLNEICKRYPSRVTK